MPEEMNNTEVSSHERRIEENAALPDVVLTPGIVATLVDLQLAGFAYSR